MLCHRLSQKLSLSKGLTLHSTKTGSLVQCQIILHSFTLHLPKTICERCLSNTQYKIFLFGMLHTFVKRTLIYYYWKTDYLLSRNSQCLPQYDYKVHSNAVFVDTVSASNLTLFGSVFHVLAVLYWFSTVVCGAASVLYLDLCLRLSKGWSSQSGKTTQYLWHLSTTFRIWLLMCFSCSIHSSALYSIPCILECFVQDIVI